MLTEDHVAELITHETIQQDVQKLKAAYKEKEANLLEISDEDFLSLILLTPAVGVALANDNISFFEELSLNKRARALSKGKYFLEKDPVAYAMQFLQKSYDHWESDFLAVIRKCLDAGLDTEHFICSTLLNIKEEKLEKEIRLAQVEYDTITAITQKLGISDDPGCQHVMAQLKAK